MKKQFLLDIDDGVPAAIREKYRPTVAMFGVYENQAVLLVQSAADAQGLTLGVPQGGINCRRGESIRQALWREMQEELPGIVLDDQRLILAEENKIPRDRESRDKWIYFVLSRVTRLPDTVNSLENKSFCTVWDPAALSSALCAARPNKARLIFSAAENAIRAGILHWDMQLVQHYLRILEGRVKTKAA